MTETKSQTFFPANFLTFSYKLSYLMNGDEIILLDAEGLPSIRGKDAPLALYILPLRLKRPFSSPLHPNGHPRR
jgi:hypothetical protein